MSWKSNIKYHRLKEEKDDEKKLLKEERKFDSKSGEKADARKNDEQNKKDWKKIFDKCKPKEKNLIEF